MKCSILFLILAVFWSAPMVTAQETMGDREKLGKVHFPVSCTTAAQQQFDRAMAMLHSFWVSPAANAFAEVAKSDPDCAMAYWGIAINRRTNPLAGAPDAAALKDGWEAVEKAKSIGLKTEEELNNEPAIGNYYKDWDKVDHQTRGLAYEKSMDPDYDRCPEDSDAAVFHVLPL